MPREIVTLDADVDVFARLHAAAALMLFYAVQRCQRYGPIHAL